MPDRKYERLRRKLSASSRLTDDLMNRFNRLSNWVREKWGPEHYCTGNSGPDFDAMFADYCEILTDTGFSGEMTGDGLGCQLPVDEVPFILRDEVETELENITPQVRRLKTEMMADFKESLSLINRIDSGDAIGNPAAIAEKLIAVCNWKLKEIRVYVDGVRRIRDRVATELSQLEEGKGTRGRPLSEQGEKRRRRVFELREEYGDVTEDTILATLKNDGTDYGKLTRALVAGDVLKHQRNEADRKIIEAPGEVKQGQELLKEKWKAAGRFVTLLKQKLESVRDRCLDIVVELDFVDDGSIDKALGEEIANTFQPNTLVPTVIDREFNDELATLHDERQAKYLKLLAFMDAEAARVEAGGETGPDQMGNYYERLIDGFYCTEYRVALAAAERIQARLDKELRNIRGGRGLQRRDKKSVENRRKRIFGLLDAKRFIPAQQILDTLNAENEDNRYGDLSISRIESDIQRWKKRGN